MSLSDDEEALFDDIYGEDDKKEEPKKELETKEEEPENDSTKKDEGESTDDVKKEDDDDETKPQDSANNEQESSSTGNSAAPPPPPPTTQDSNVSNASSEAQKADLSRDAGKMFIGGLDWDTTEDRLKEYFSKYGEVIDHTIMRESSTGRSRGFGFLTFATSKSVDDVLKTQHVLDGKVIDPKRAIPRDEQDKTGKIFVGGIAPEVRPKEFEEFFGKFGTIIDAQLMLDKDTGRSRGFGFVTFDAPDAVDRVCQGRYLDFNGRQIEVKRAEPRGPQQQQNHIQQQQQRYLQQQGYQTSYQQGGAAMPNMAAAAVPGAQMYGGMTPEAMTQYWQQMQQYWMQFQQQQQQAGGAPMAGLPQNLQNFQQQFQQAQAQAQQQQGGQSPVAGESSAAKDELNQDGNGGADQGYNNNGGYNNGGYNSYRRRGPSMDTPRGPRGGGRGGRGRGRGRGGYSRNDYHPYSRN